MKEVEKKYLYKYHIGEKDVPSLRKVLIAHETKTYIHLDGEVNWKRRLDKRYESHLKGWCRTEKEAMKALLNSMQKNIKREVERGRRLRGQIKHERALVKKVRAKLSKI